MKMKSKVKKCRWKRFTNVPDQNIYAPSCYAVYARYNPNWNFCPYCGRKISLAKQGGK